MKHSGIDWFGKIPEAWDIVQLGRVTRSYCDGPFGSGLKSSHYAPSGVRVIRLQNIGAGVFHGEDAAFVSAEHFNSLSGHDACAGDLVIAGLGDEHHPVGRACIVPDHIGIAMVKADCFRFRLDERRVSTSFVSWFLASTAAGREAEEFVRGATRMRINLSGAARLRIPLPPLGEQARIARFLTVRCASIDASVSEHQHALKLLEEQRKTLITRAISRGLDASIQLRDSTVTWIGQCPAHWRIARIVRVARLESGHTPSRQVADYWKPNECTIPWFSLADVWQIRDGRQEYLGDTAEKISEAGVANSSARVLPAGTVVLSRTASVGFSGIMPRPMATTQDFANWVCGPSLVPEYLLYVLRSMRHEFDRMMQGSTHQTIYMPDLKKLTIPLPPLDEQHAIVAFVRARNAAIDAAAVEARRAIELLHEYRQSLIIAAVTGRIAPEAPAE